MAFRTLTSSEPDFSLPYLDEQSFREVLRFADYLGYDRKTSRSLYRLNLDKCSTLSIHELDRLARYGLYLSKDLMEKISKLRSEIIINISLKGGDLVISATPSAEKLVKKYSVYEPKSRTYRVKPKDLWTILDSLKDYKVDIAFDTKLKLFFQPTPFFTLRDYQEECYNAWRNGGFRGVVALPTASGKTLLALQAIADLGVKTMIIVPSIDLLNQWKKRLSSHLKIPDEYLGVYGAGRREVRDIIVITYDSAYLNAEELSSRFMLLIADEAHHAVAPEFRRIFDCSIARYRMGLTATPLRSDGLHEIYEDIIGPIIGPIREGELREKGYIAGYDVKKIYVDLSPEEMAEYRSQLNIYQEYCGRMFQSVYDPRERFQLCLRYAARDPKAREALRAKSRARVLALGSEKKVEMVKELLSEYRERKVLIFSRYVDTVREVSRRYLIPLIVAETSNEERRMVLNLFQRGEITKLASGMTLEEGIDVPDAQVGIIISGSGSNREYLQRVGRLLRPKKERALIIELVTRGTMDQELSSRRKGFREWR